MYYKKFNAYPPNIDALVKTSEIRFLRKKYADPTTGKEEWNSIHFGQNKAPTAMGYFGQPLIGSTLAGTGVSGGNGASNPGGGSIGSSTPASAFSGADSFFGNASSATDAGTASSAGSTDSTSTSASGSSTSAQTFGGPGIIGFSPGSPKPSIRIYKTKNHYNQWEFVFDPLAEQMMGRLIPAKHSQTAASAFPSAFSSSAPAGN
jgi:hypothetical protein